MVEQARKHVQDALDADDTDEREAALERALARLEAVGSTRTAPGPRTHPTDHDHGTDPDDDRDDDHAGDTQSARALAAVVEAREQLRRVDRGALGDDHESRLVTALEALETIIMQRDLRTIDALDATSPAAGGEHTAGGDAVPVTIELSQPMVEMIDLVVDDEEGQTVSEWIRTTVRDRLMSHDQQYWNSETVVVEADLPPETARWAGLWARHYAATGSEPVDVEHKLLDYVNLDYTWRVEDGGEIDLPPQPGDDDAGTGDSDDPANENESENESDSESDG